MTRWNHQQHSMVQVEKEAGLDAMDSVPKT